MIPALGGSAWELGPSGKKTLYPLSLQTVHSGET